MGLLAGACSVRSPAVRFRNEFAASRDPRVGQSFDKQHTEPAAATSAAAEIVVGPLLRYVGTTTATVWVETSAAAEVTILGHRATTFQVERHHYALVLLEGLEPASVIPYDGRLDSRGVEARGNVAP